MKAAKERISKPTSCRYYACNGMFGSLIPNPGSNQCGIIVSSHSPCLREVKGESIDDTECPIAIMHAAGTHMEPDLGPRNTRFHRKIIRTVAIPNTRVGHTANLECGHTVQMFGRLDLANGVVFCQQCFDANARPKG